ncbi:hypothetical protein M0802_001522 [Mischocyttarus mexicanus]|nr:hypothetical protein M0802_001522 [Mischocyttarus mexicanus]
MNERTNEQANEQLSQTSSALHHVLSKQVVNKVCVGVRSITSIVKLVLVLVLVVVVKEEYRHKICNSVLYHLVVFEAIRKAWLTCCVLLP